MIHHSYVLNNYVPNGTCKRVYSFAYLIAKPIAKTISSKLAIDGEVQLCTAYRLIAEVVQSNSNAASTSNLVTHSKSAPSNMSIAWTFITVAISIALVNGQGKRTVVVTCGKIPNRPTDDNTHPV